jgi:hypothetical protein
MANNKAPTRNVRKGCVAIYARDHVLMKKLAHRTGMKMIRVPSLLLRAWELLTPEQRREAMLPNDASDIRQSEQTQPELTPA